MTRSSRDDQLRTYRNSKLYRSLARTLRVYDRWLVERIRAAGFDDFQPSFPRILSNLDVRGTRIGVLAGRAGVTRQAVGKLVGEIEAAGYVRREPSPEDARATVVRFTPRGRRLLSTVLALVEEYEGALADIVGAASFQSLRVSLAALADVIDPQGAFGDPDEPG